ncbi:type II secretion system F family protein [Aeoliella mucimassa]|uniref:type II secretion system F family protein n=1 Tax=Aeoliella mucimassa TaxID=2527972 RepID=UPI0018D311C8|nr:type II secretion system F family protein [Aeoliella mucimassa]
MVPLFLFGIGFLLRWGAKLLYGVRGPLPEDPTVLAVNMVSWLFVGMGLLVGLGMPLGVAMVGGVFGMVFWVIAWFALVDTVQAMRQSKRRMNAKVLSVAEREGRLAESLDLLQQVWTGQMLANDTRNLAMTLRTGQPLYESIVLNHRALPVEAAAYAAVGSLANDEPAALDELSQPDSPVLSIAWRGWFDYIAYAIGMLVMMTGILSFLMIKIVPQFRQIFEEFGLELPAMTEMLVMAADRLMPLAALAMMVLMLVMLAIGIVGIMMLSGYDGFNRILDRFRGPTRMASALRLLAFAIERKVELRSAVYALVQTYPSSKARQQLHDCYLAIEAGRPWLSALAQSRVLRRDEAALVDSAQAVGNVPWALRQIADRRERTAANRLNLFGKFFGPLIVISLSMVVGYIVISLFIPLIKLIQGLT